MVTILQQSSNPVWRVPKDFAIDLRASALADRVAKVILEANRNAIVAGVRADDGAAQPKLDPEGGSGRDAAAGRRPDVRGNTGKRDGFPLTLRRGRTQKKRGETNSVVLIEAPRARPAWLAEEKSKRGVEYLFITGRVAEAIEAETMKWLEEVTRPGKK